MATAMGVREDFDKVVKTEEFETKIPATNASDRCDRCQSRSYHAVILESGLRLDFCHHCWKINSAVLLDIAVDIRDDSYLLDNREAGVHA